MFVEECKSGPSQGVGHSRLDAWALRKTWSPTTSIGYELKTARHDFVQDEKWPNYLPLCHQLYFVCPPRLIDPRELPGECGLIWAHERRLLTKKKAPHRQIELPTEMLIYILMSRTLIVSNMREANQRSPVDRWRAWLELKEADRQLGSLVRGRHNALLLELRAENARLRDENLRLQQVKDELKKLDLEDGAAAWQVQQRAARQAVPNYLPDALRRVAAELDKLKDG